METTVRSAVADYQLGEPVAPGCFRAVAPGRLGFPPGTGVLVWELPVDASGWPQVSADLSLFATVDSPNLLRLLEAGPDLDPAGAGGYLVTEEPVGGSLESPAGSWRMGDKVLAVAGAARGAHALHEAGLAHGSITAESILLTERGGVLGPPRPAGPDGAVARAERWQSVDVLDPELLRGGAPSRGSDVWGLAATLHQICTAASLYPGLESQAPVTAVQKVLFGTPVVHESVPADLAEILEACFERDPSNRPRTALDLAERLESAEVPR